MTVVLVLVVPPAPLHSSVKVVVPASGALLALPLVEREPLQPSLAVQLAALVLLQLSEVG